MADSGSEGSGRQLRRIKAWVEDTERHLDTQSSNATFDLQDIAMLLLAAKRKIQQNEAKKRAKKAKVLAQHHGKPLEL